MAERLGTGPQNLAGRFDSACTLQIPSIMIKQENDSFNKGLNRVLPIHHEAVRDEIIYQLGLKNVVSYSVRRAGYVHYSPAERRCIEEVFAKYGVPSSDVWGEEQIYTCVKRHRTL